DRSGDAGRGRGRGELGHVDHAADDPDRADAGGAEATGTMSRRTKGFTLIEVMIAVGVLALMMVIAWGTVVQTMRANKHFGAVQDRYREARNALAKMVSDIQTAYVSSNEDRTQQEPRTFFIGDASGDINSLRFSCFAHTRLYADANESDQTVVAYFS